MARNNKVRIDRIIIIFLSIIIIVGVLGFGVSKLIDVLFNNDNNPINNPDIVDPSPIKTNETTKVSLVDYQIYEDDTDSLGFNFIIATLKFEDENNISFDLGNLQTSEKIYLNNVSKYINTLHENAYNIESLNIVNTVVSDSKNYTCNVFIPFTTDSYSLRLLNSLDASMIEFDLTKNLNNVTAIKFETEKDIIIGDTNVRVSKSYISNMMMHNGVEFDASGMNYYTFNIYVEEVEDNVKIIDAQFIPNNSNEQLKALNTQYRSAKVDNCLDKVLTVGENGALFFEGSSKNEDSLKGYLMLMFSNSDEWVKISTVLE
jgi:hypothetical protein